MHACPLPTDSILRRHFEQLASSAGLPQPPQDSILQRHYRQLLDARLEARPAAAPADRPAATPAAAQAQPAASPRPAAAPDAPQVMRSQPAHAAREHASMPDRNPPPAPATSWFSRLLARIFGN
ncbi:MAG: hypothetical protein ACLGH1_04315 [Gammaproteobacteria bacterium]